MLHNSVLINSFFYKSTLYKNTEAQFAQKIRTSLEHAQLQMRNLKNNSQFAIYVMQTEQNYCTDILLTKKLISLSINTSSHCFIFKIYPVKRLRNYTQYVTSQIFAKNHS